MKNTMMTLPAQPPLRMYGFSIIELMISLTIGLFITGAVISTYLSTKQSFNRQGQLAEMQQNARAAFEYLGSDGRAAGHVGCYSGLPVTASTWVNALSSATTLPYAFAGALEGYDAVSATATITSAMTATSAYSVTASNWATNSATSGSSTTAPVTAYVDSGGAALGSDILILRTTVGLPYRLTTTAGAATFNFDAVTSGNTVQGFVKGSTCGGSGTRYSEFCANSIGIVSSCSRATVFQATNVAVVGAVGTITHAASGTAGPGNATSTWTTNIFPSSSELFRAQTVIYYVGLGATGPALFRKVYDGESTSPTADELIDNVENMQVTYGIDTGASGDGMLDSYVTAGSVTDWNKVIAVRIGLLMRSSTLLAADAKVPTTITVNGQAVSLPAASAPRYDRRVFTTTIALRNRIKYQ